MRARTGRAKTGQIQAGQCRFSREGQSLTEYAIIGALVAVVAIPSLALFQKEIAKQLMDILNPGQSSASAPPSALLTSPPIPGQVSTVPPASPPALSSIPPTPPSSATSGSSGLINGSNWQAAIDPSSGQLLYSVGADGSGATNATSAEGVQQLSQMTGSLSDQLTALIQTAADNGTPLPANLQSKIQALASNGHTVAANETLLAPDADAGTLDAAGQNNMNTLISSGNNFNTAYAALEDYLQTNGSPDPNLGSQIAGYAGMISATLNGNFGHFAGSNQVNDFNTYVGTMPQQVPDVAQAAGITNTNATAIGNTTQTP